MRLVVIFGLLPNIKSFFVFLLEIFTRIHFSPVAFEPLANLNNLWLACLSLLVPCLLELLTVQSDFPIELLRLFRLSVSVARDDIALTKPLLEYFANLFSCFLSSDISVHAPDYHGVSLDISVLVLHWWRILNWRHSFAEAKEKYVGDHHCKQCHFSCQVSFIFPQIVDRLIK